MTRADVTATASVAVHSHTKVRCLTVRALRARWQLDRRTLEKILQSGALEILAPTPRTRRVPLSSIREYERQHRHEPPSSRP